MVRGVRWIPVLVMVALLVTSTLACNMAFSNETQTELLGAVPRVFFTAPVNRLIDPSIPQYAEGAQVVFRAVAQDPGVGVQRIVFSVDERVIGEVTSQQVNGERLLMGQAIWTAAAPKGYGISVEAYRADGTLVGSDQRSIRVADRSVTVPRAQATMVTNTLPTATPSIIPASGIGPVISPAPSDRPVDVSSTISVTGPSTRIDAASLNVRRGPGINYEPVGTLVQGEIVPVVGRSLDGAWYAITFRSQTAWIFASLTTFHTGDAGNLPVIAVPEALVTPAPTQTIALSPADLVVSAIRLDPTTPTAGVTFRVYATITNLGGSVSPEADALVTLQPGDERSPADPHIPALQPGESREVFFNVTLAAGGTGLTGVVEIDVNDVVPEGLEGEANNVHSLTYDVLAAEVS